MFRLFNGFLAIIVVIIVLRWFVPQEAADLASQILIKILTLIKDLLMQVNLPQWACKKRFDLNLFFFTKKLKNKSFPQTKTPARRRVFFILKSLLSALDVNSVGAFRRHFRVKGDGIALTKFIELDVNQSLAVEEQILFLTFDGDEAEAPIGQSLNGALHVILKLKIN